ncbi:hypothetical protein [Cylindrospermum sp. FACHB-282]|uniref:hypothetical protein n=1 Tax=Cylindrospermum sp. FACHB-282 TaxID=2692794 RepID=UPI00168264A0|nr:hypothetical protein [Cylindrospermum sp. FACHB-282]MBD2388551.1 hypothetical protein [Cylindrospermum sp. FACHB-282]
MAQLSQPRRSRILSSSAIAPSDAHHRQEQRQALASRCRAVFEHLREQLMAKPYNWFIAIDPDSEEYLINSESQGLMQQIRQAYGDNEVKLTIFRLNGTGTCGRLWV